MAFWLSYGKMRYFVRSLDKYFVQMVDKLYAVCYDDYTQEAVALLSRLH